MSLTLEDRARGRAERLARGILRRLDTLVLLDQPIRPETRDAMLVAITKLTATPVAGDRR